MTIMQRHVGSGTQINLRSVIRATAGRAMGESLWSERKIEVLRTEAALSKSVAEISIMLGCSQQAVRDKCRRSSIDLHPEITWTDEKIERLRILWGEGRSAGYIANDLGGVTRNAVIGKVHRLGIEPRAKPAPRKPRRVRRPRQKLTMMSEPPLKPVILKQDLEQPSLGISVADLQEHHCRWIPFDDRLHCGHPKSNGFSYCAFHSRIAYRSVNE